MRAPRPNGRIRSSLVSAREVLRGALLATSLDRLARDQLLDGQIELSRAHAHAFGNLLDTLALVALHVLEEACRELHDLVRRTLRALRESTTRRRAHSACTALGAAATARGFAPQRITHRLHRGVANQTCKITGEVFQHPPDLFVNIGLRHGDG